MPTGSFHAYWRRPHAYLRPQVRRATSVWARVGPAATQRAIRHLGDDLRTGRWAERNHEITTLAETDLGARLLIAEPPGPAAGEDAAMRVRFVGTGDAFGSGGRWQTCILLSGDGRVMLADCGATTLAALKSQGLDPAAIRAVALTHLHGDHFGGLPFLISAPAGRRAGPAGRAAAAPAGTASSVCDPGKGRGGGMSFIFMVFHWPEEGQRDTLAQSMREMRDVLVGTPGCVAVEPPYLTEDGGCLVGISKWESRQAFFASGITLRPPDETVEGETRPRQRFFLEEAQTAGPQPPSTG